QEMALHAVAGFGDALMQGSVQADEYYFLKKNGSLNRKNIHSVKPEMELSVDQLSVLYTTASKLEKHFTSPQDIEFVFDNDTLYVVQCRPVTQTIPQVTVYNKTMETLRLPKKQIAAQQPVVNNLLGLVKGRIYYNINNWYKGLQLLP